MPAPNVDPNIPLFHQLDSAKKFAAMDSDSPYHVMMVTTSMVMDAAETVKLKLDSHAMADHQTAETHAQKQFQVPFLLLHQANPDYSERSYLTFD
jgi:hypothetical protein